MKKLIFFALAVLLISSMLPLGTAFAGSASISISGPKSVEAGKTYTYTITLSGSGVSSAMVTSISTSGIFSGSGSGFEIGSGGENTNGSKSVDVSVTVSSSASAGDTGTISASGQYGYWNDEMTDVLTGSMSKSLTATVPTPDPTTAPTAPPAATNTPAPTAKPSATAKPTTKPSATAKPTTKPTKTEKPSSTSKPTKTPKPTTTPDVSPTPTTSVEPSPTATVIATPTPTPKPLEWSDVEGMVGEMQAGGVLNVDMKGKTEIPMSVLSELQNNEGTLEIDFGDYSCSIDSSTLKNLPEDMESLDLSMSMTKDEVLSQAAGGFDVYQLNFNYHGELPGIFKYTFYAGEHKPGDTLYLYYSYEQAGIIEAMQTAVVDEDGYVTFEIYHCSSYFVSDKIVEGAMNNFEEDDVSVEASHEPVAPTGISVWILIICIAGTALLSIAGTMYFSKSGFFKMKSN